MMERNNYEKHPDFVKDILDRLHDDPVGNLCKTDRVMG